MRRWAMVLALAALGAVPALADGDPENGQALFQKRCATCHVMDAETNKVGPHLAGVYGRKAGSVADYGKYSKGMQEIDIVWDDANLDVWLTNPFKFIKGTKMAMAIKDPEERADIIAYLKQQSGQ
jgi:cytochrome c